MSQEITAQPESARIEGSFLGKLEKVCLLIIRWGTYLLLLTPLIIDAGAVFPFVATKSFYFRALVEIILLAYLILALVFPRYRPRFSAIFGALAFLVVVFVISSAFGIDFTKGIWGDFRRVDGLISWFHYLIFFIILSSIFKQKKEWMVIMGVSVGVAVLVSLASLIFLKETNIQSFWIMNLSKKGATLGNSSFLGTYLLFNAFINIWLLTELKGRKIWRSILAGCFVLIVIALMISTARAAMVCFIGGVILIGLLYLIFKARKKVWKIVGISVILLGILSFFFVAYFAFQYDSGVHTFLVEHKLFKQPRVVVWTMAWEGFKERPLFGWGLENFDSVFARHYDPCLGTSECGSGVRFDRAHNIVFDMGINSGIIGLLSYLAVFVISIYLLAKRFFRTKQFWISAVFITLLIAYFFQNLTVFDMVASYMMFFLVLAFISVCTVKDEEEELVEEIKFSLGKKILVFLLIFCVAVAFFQFCVQPVRASHLAVECAAFKNLPFKQRVAACQKALDITPVGRSQVSNDLGKVVADSSSLIQKDGILSSDFQEGFKAASNRLGETIKQNPLDLYSYLQLGQLYLSYPLGDRKYFDEAEGVFKEAVVVSPTCQKSYFGLAQAELWKGKYSEAVELLQQAVNLEPNLAQSQWLLAETAFLAGNSALAKEALDKAEELDYPYWENINLMKRYSDIREQVQEFDKIIYAYQNAISKNEKGEKYQARLNVELGTVYFELGQTEEANKYFNIAKSINPSWASQIEDIIKKGITNQ